MNIAVLKYKKIFKRTVSCLIILLLLLTISKRLNMLLVKRYSIYGIDVSHYQGKIDWQMLKNQDVGFVYIKATEGSSYKDKNFSKNWKNAQFISIPAGAYHFFSFDSSADAQAEHFIGTVGSLSGKLVPMVDVEYYADKEKKPPDKRKLVVQLQRFLNILEEEYGIKPIIYTTYRVYHKYIKDAFTQYPLWIRNVYYFPFDIDRQWQFWQYSDIGDIEGINGNVDLNVFQGTVKEFGKFIVS